MKQLTGLDTSFLNMETAQTFGHVSGLAIYDAATSGKPVTFEDMKQLLEERIHLAAPYRRRLVEVPFGLDHPYWIEDPGFDIDFHIRRIAVPPPGDEQQLSELVSRIVARPLDRAHPLWELYVIEGLAGGRIAQLTKIHHCAIDGVSGVELLSTLLDESPEPQPASPARKRWRPDPEPTQLEMMARGLWAVAGQPRKAIRLQREVLRSLPDLARMAGLSNLPGLRTLERVLWRREGSDLLSRPAASAPRTPFNRSITPHRRYSYGSLSLQAVKAIKNEYHVTVNDVVMTLCAGALRRWLVDHDALPEDPLLAMVPVSIRSEDQRGDMGNQVSAMVARIPTHLADPEERLRFQHEEMKIAKIEHQAMSANLMQDFAQFAPPAVAARAARVIARSRIVDVVAPPFNVVISNVPGPRQPLYSAGARLLGSYPVSAISDGVGLNITVQSYQDQLDFGLISCRELVPDIWHLMAHLSDSLDELVALVKPVTSPEGSELEDLGDGEAKLLPH